MLRRSFTAIVLSASVCFAQAGTNLSGTWTFTHRNDRFRGKIVLRQTGTDLTGTWHTSLGKIEDDTSVVGRVDGMIVVLTRSIGDNQQNFVLTLSADGNQLDGFGDGWFLKHGNLNMRRAAPSAKGASTRASSTGASSPGTSSSGTSGTRTYSAPTSPARASSSSTAGTAARSAQTAVSTKKQKWMGIGLPPARGTYRWTIQSVVVRGKSTKKYSSFYYEASTNRSVEEPLSLPGGGEIVGVFPDDCEFAVQDEAGHSFTFRNEEEAKARGFDPGTWSVYPLKCGGVAVYVK